MDLYGHVGQPAALVLPTPSRDVRLTMKLHLKTIGGKNWTFDVEPTDTIEHVKCQIFAADNVPVSHLVLTLQGRLLDNEHTLAHYDIQDGYCLLVNLRLRG